MSECAKVVEQELQVVRQIKEEREDIRDIVGRCTFVRCGLIADKERGFVFRNASCQKCDVRVE